MNILEAMVETYRLARKQGTVCCLYQTPNMYEFRIFKERGWLFMAYPGGRKVLSKEGAELVKKHQEAA